MASQGNGYEEGRVYTKGFNSAGVPVQRGVSAALTVARRALPFTLPFLNSSRRNVKGQLMTSIIENEVIAI